MTASSYVTSCFKESEIEQYIEEFEEFRESAAETSEFADSLVQVVEQRNQQIAELEEVIVVIEADLEESQQELVTVTAQRDAAREAVTDSMFNVTPEPVQRYIVTLEKENAVQKEVITDLTNLVRVTEDARLLLQTNFDDAMIRGDSLQIIVDNIPPPPPDPTKWLGFIPKPTPVQAGTAGIVIGIALDAFVLNRGN